VKRVAIPIVFAVCSFVPTLAAEQPENSELLNALARSVAIFGRSAPDLTARETLTQRGRRGEMQILKKTRKNRLKNILFTLPEDFQTHEVVSEYGFGPVGDASGFHEVRRVLTVDGAPVTGAARHALTIGAASGDDDTKKQLLEDLEQTQLQGSVVDFGPLLLLFSRTKQRDFEWQALGRKTGDSETVYVLQYRRVSGDTAVTEFREKTESRHPFSGQIWLRETDLVPVHITVSTEEILTDKYSLRNEAEIDYQPTPYGLAPAAVLHRQYLNRDLLVENQFRYTDYHGRTLIP
jgi:hypothetical protein